MTKNLNGSINLAKLSHVRMTTKKGAKCLLIPIEANLLEEDENGNVYMPIRVRYEPEGDKYGQNGFIAKSTPSKLYKEMDDAAKEAAKAKNPILGSIKDFSGSGDQPTGQASAETFDQDGDTSDLPF
jgi:hypothetical protein